MSKRKHVYDEDDDKLSSSVFIERRERILHELKNRDYTNNWSFLYFTENITHVQIENPDKNDTEIMTILVLLWANLSIEERHKYVLF